MQPSPRTIGPSRLVERDGVRWSVDAPPNPNGWDFWAAWEDGWERETLEVVDRFAEADSTLLDVGAWIGPVTLWAARRGPVVAVEPDPVALDYLLANVRSNPDGHPIRVLPGALTLFSGSATIAPSDEGFGHSMTHVAPGGYPVRALSIAEVFSETRILSCSLVKVDVEGMESVLLPTIGPFLARRRIPLLVSLHEPWWDMPPDPCWVDDFRAVETVIPGSMGQLLALP